jgi:hypothetical protein
MEKTEPRTAKFTRSEKEEINWAQYLDYTKFFEPAEINNISLEVYKKNFE